MTTERIKTVQRIYRNRCHMRLQAKNKKNEWAATDVSTADKD